MQTTTLSSKGQLVIPSQVRALANVAAGDAFQVRYLDGEIRLRPLARATRTTLDEVAGILAGAGGKRKSDAQLEAAVRARLMAEDAATLPRKPKTRAARG